MFQDGFAVIYFRPLLPCTIGPNLVKFYPILMFKGSFWGLPSPFPSIGIEFLQSGKNQMQVCNHKLELNLSVKLVSYELNHFDNFIHATTPWILNLP